MSADNQPNPAPKITIVTPNYNCSEYIGECIGSVLSQNYDALEYIVIDGVSTDGSIEVIRTFQDKITKFICEPDTGHANALNKAFSVATGEIMGWINSDDILMPGCLRSIANVFTTNPHIDWITGRTTVISDSTYIYDVRPPRHWSRLRFMCGDYRFVQQESTFWRRSLWDRAGASLDESFKLANDLDLWCRFFRHADLYSVDGVLGAFRLRAGQRSQMNLAGYLDEARAVLAREFSLLPDWFRNAYADILPRSFAEMGEAWVAKRGSLTSLADVPMVRFTRGRRSYVAAGTEALPRVATPRAGRVAFDGTLAYTLKQGPKLQARRIRSFNAVIGLRWPAPMTVAKEQFGQSYPPMPFIFGPIRLHQLTTTNYRLTLLTDDGDVSVNFAVDRQHDQIAIDVTVAEELHVSVNGRALLKSKSTDLAQKPGIMLGSGFLDRFWAGDILNLSATFENGTKWQLDPLKLRDSSYATAREHFGRWPRLVDCSPDGNDAWATSLDELRARHSGQRCFIMGNGPSLNKMDLNLLQDEIVFGCNAIFLLFDRIRWRPKYYCCVDVRVLPDRAQDIIKMLHENPEMTAFFPSKLHFHDGSKRQVSTREIIPPAPHRYYFQERPQSFEQLPDSKFSSDANSFVVQPYTVVIAMMQIAAYLGFSEIYLIGCDTSYTVPESVKREGATTSAPGGLLLTSTKDDDPNHFDPRYFGSGRQWHDPQVEKMVEHHRWAKVALDRMGVRTYNATVGGNLEVFPRRDFESLFGTPAAGSQDEHPAHPVAAAKDAAGQGDGAVGLDTPAGLPAPTAASSQAALSGAQLPAPDGAARRPASLFARTHDDPVRDYARCDIAVLNIDPGERPFALFVLRVQQMAGSVCIDLRPRDCAPASLLDGLLPVVEDESGPLMRIVVEGEGVFANSVDHRQLTADAAAAVGGCVRMVLSEAAAQGTVLPEYVADGLRRYVSLLGGLS